MTTADNAPAQALAGSGPPVPLLEQMTGQWQVKQTMWTGPDAPPVEQPPAMAKRRLAAGGGFIEEEMTLATGSENPFTRTSHINFNEIDGVFEYFSIDTRAPQQMHYQSQPVTSDFKGALQFRGGTFVAGQWGDRKNAAFGYRVELSPVRDGQQTMQLFLRLIAAGAQREFVAFKYEYQKR
jgi:hypothetical protein